MPHKTQQQLEILFRIRNINDHPNKFRKVDEPAKVDLDSMDCEDDDVLEVKQVEPSLAVKSTETFKEQKSENGAAAQGQKQTLATPAVASSNSMADFWKDRRQAFGAKNPEKMRAASLPPKAVKVEMPVISPELRRFIPVVVPRGRMAEKLKQSAPYNFFMTTISSSTITHNDPLSLTFLELLDPSLGDLESSIQINFEVHAEWLLAQYSAAKLLHLPLVILFGTNDPLLMDNNVNRRYPNINSFFIKVPGPIGCHHAKVMLFFYKDRSMRVVVSTANLYHGDWHNHVQGLWISDRLPALPHGTNDLSAGESVTMFRRDLVNFLSNYGNPMINAYMERIKKSDFSSIKVFLITAIPGSHRNDAHGHSRLETLLEENSAPVPVQHPVIMQSSSLGNFGRSAADYLSGEIVGAMKKHSGAVRIERSPEFKLIYPSLSNVKRSHDGLLGGGCLPYSRGAHNRQPWLNQYLYQWKCISRNRDRAMPHIKSYCRYSDEEGIYWFVLTSANMSKSAWGVKRGGTLNINSYEAGVAFFPRLILNKEVFPMKPQQQQGGDPIFKLPFDVPLVPYGDDDTPYCMDDGQAYREALMQMQ